ncbi:hypothetical protein Tco_0154095 [Tanacetum coccineum]
MTHTFAGVLICWGFKKKKKKKLNLGVSSWYDSSGHKIQADECIENDARASCASIKRRGLGDERRSFNENGVASTFSRAVAIEHAGSTRAESKDEWESFN